MFKKKTDKPSVSKTDDESYLDLFSVEFTTNTISVCFINIRNLKEYVYKIDKLVVFYLKKYNFLKYLYN